MPLRLCLGLLLLTSAACAWSVPADPGRNAAMRSARGDVVPAENSAAAAIYAVKCAQCHEPFPPSRATASEWPALVRKYGPRAGLFGAEREAVLAWLQANAR